MTLFDDLVRDIEYAYAALGHTLSWRFSYSSRSSLDTPPKIMLIGLNPGGTATVPPVASSEAGNAYRIERWGERGEHNTLQRQVGALFQAVAELLPGIDADSLVDAAFTANLCPFRSPSWIKLPEKRKSLEFSERLWEKLLRERSPRVILCLGQIVARAIGNVLSRLGWLETSSDNKPVGWGLVTYSTRTFVKAESSLTLIRLPHLSRFQVFARAGSRDAASEIAELVAQTLRS